ncbi:TIGR04282 family arsenosugar biosynthesis glycosyltransferase [Streptomyces boninensis]|uniref:TIGR04282 family arsenosugar biosynthesis glycosyltransferase n=1 Tax=Streptomyces boninensis TaxID=2039455 RepID=UPI003B20F2C5
MEGAGGATGGLTLLVVAKEPVAGRVKTRLQSAYSPEQAARLAAAALADTLRTVRALPAARRVLVLDGRPGPWLPRGFEVWPQCAGGLDERLAAAFDTCTGDGPALLVGMDTPQLTRASLAPALRADAWRHTDAYYGPAADGGFWALGMARPDGDLVRGVPMSTAHTGAAQRARLTAAGLRVADLPPLRDVDTPADVAEVAPLCAPDASFRREATRLRPPGEAVPAAAPSPPDHPTPQPAEAPQPQPAAAGPAGRPPAPVRAGRPS